MIFRRDQGPDEEELRDYEGGAGEREGFDEEIEAELEALEAYQDDGRLVIRAPGDSEQKISAERPIGREEVI